MPRRAHPRRRHAPRRCPAQDVSGCQRISPGGLTSLAGLARLQTLTAANIACRTGAAADAAAAEQDPGAGAGPGPALAWVPAAVTSLSLKGLCVPLRQQEALLAALPPRLQHLDLSSCQLQSPGAILAGLAGQLPALRALDLSRGLAQLHLPASALQPLAALSELTSLKLSGVCWDEAEAPQQPSLLGQLLAPSSEQAGQPGLQLAQGGAWQLLSCSYPAAAAFGGGCAGSWDSWRASGTWAGDTPDASSSLGADVAMLPRPSSVMSNASMTDQGPVAAAQQLPRDQGHPNVRRVLDLGASAAAPECLLAPALQGVQLSEGSPCISGGAAAATDATCAAAGSSSRTPGISEWLDVQLKNMHTRHQQRQHTPAAGTLPAPATHASQTWLAGLTKLQELHIKVKPPGQAHPTAAGSGRVPRCL
jgi:hypothetical protein